jgi:transcription antitermination factor NusG
MQSAEEGNLWHAFHVRTRFEKVVSRHLLGEGYEEFLPLYNRTSRWSDRTKQLELPLFPGYVFCRFNPVHRMPILTIPGVNAIVGIGTSLMPAEESELANIQTLLASNLYCEPWPLDSPKQWSSCSRDTGTSRVPRWISSAALKKC